MSPIPVIVIIVLFCTAPLTIFIAILSDILNDFAKERHKQLLDEIRKLKGKE